MKKRIIPIFVPHKGCPHDCIFCNQKKITGVSTDVTSEDARNIIEECLETIDKDADVEIAFFGGSFTAIDIDIQKSLLSVAKEYVEKGLVKDIRMSTRPDCIDEDILSMLKEYKTSIIELGVQSLDEKVLLDSIRGHQSEIVYKSSKMIKNSGIKLGLQMMIGLPADTEEKCIFTAKKFVELKPDCVRVYPTLVVKDTGLEKLMEQNKYNPFTLEESVNIVKKVLVLFYVNNINVIRVGLQATDDIQIGKAVLAGPYHPAFRELVESDMIKDYLEFVILQNKNIKQMLVKSNKKNISKIIGNKKTNVKYMEEKFGVLLKTQESDLDINQLEIVLDGKSLISANMRDIHRKLYDIYDL
ncbi:elongator complex protein 3 [Clostridioides difficile]|uniref:elongator complex protein 3 n=1 Tax=Clostridioides difficile TaxID=1496 RepID=UPI00038CC5B8|nr:radical SAM protein [Clostridioides difficile]AXU52989.1 radical SAM superfamily protein [Clostridioides difficile]EGT3735627.1 radical SAM protein [Clostridioides difficile]EGT3790326.1 radical SAM protein [Clostridioides difficile]EGT4733524.1 radical SAM protein [Clostridioides difficile]EGT4842851.1 radical SAM protein [Clostridioides difficile]